MSYNKPYKSVRTNYNSYGTPTSTTYKYGCSNGTTMTFTHPSGRSNYNYSSSRKYRYY